VTRELLAILVIVPTVAASTLLTWWLTMKLVPAEPRRLVKWLYPAMMLVLATAIIGNYVANHVDQGDYVCAECGRSTGMVTLGDIRFHVAPLEFRGVGPEVDEYECAFPTRPHTHEWIDVGCHMGGVDLPFMPAECVRCYKMSTCTWYRDLPKLSDRAEATALATKFAAATQGDQRYALMSYDRTLDDKASPDVRFAAWHDAWRRDHPDWP
jgi:hypothetical protein